VYFLAQCLGEGKLTGAANPSFPTNPGARKVRPYNPASADSRQ